jgi:hypothetical protein
MSAATAALVAAGSVLALATAAVAVGILAGARWLSPAHIRDRSAAVAA